MKVFFAPLLAAWPLIIIAHDVESKESLESAPGVLETSIGRFVFTPNVCAIYEEDGIPDIEMEGIGASPDGEPFYFEFSSTGNEITIRLGVSEPFVSSEREIRAGRYVSEAFDVQFDGDVLRIPMLLLADQNGDQVGTASLELDCTPGG